MSISDNSNPIHEQYSEVTMIVGMLGYTTCILYIGVSFM